MKRALEELEDKFQGYVEIPYDNDMSRYGETPQVSKAPASAEEITSGMEKKDHNNSGLEDPPNGDDFDSGSDMESDYGDHENLEEIMQTPEALRDMRCYVEFIDRDIIPLYNRFDDGQIQKVAFEDLWCLFRVGELVYLPHTGESSHRYHQLWRIYRIECPAPHYSYTDLNDGWLSLDELEDDGQDVFTLFCYYIDYNGSSYGAVRHKFDIKSFPGERDIDSLEVYPIRFYSERKPLLESLRKQGSNFQRFLNDRYQAYNGWTLIRNPPLNDSDPDAETLKDYQGNKMRHPEFVESHVIVDLEEAFQLNSDWRPDFHRPSASKPFQSDINDDNMPIQQWNDRSRTQLLYSINEAVQTSDSIEMRQRKDNIQADAFLQHRTKESRSRTAMQRGAESLSREDLVLLPKRLFAYVLRERRFVPIDINYLKPIVRDPDVFDSLKIPRRYKTVLRGLVNSHFHKRGLERNLVDDRLTEGLSQDLIQGKGRGLVILLHGVPGVGKTATAEAVAIESQKPLFVITCGDLGLTAEDVETKLGNVFRLAHLWDCVLLLDEADVFLSQRSRMDMKRNALVSGEAAQFLLMVHIIPAMLTYLTVFLRVLEYYHGLLFLTTNRVGTIDEAFKSRIHISLYYPMLDQIQTQAIFRVNIDKMRALDEQRAALVNQPVLDIREDEILEFSNSHFDTMAPAEADWNGRQIRNAFQIAAGIAYYTYATQVEKARQKGYREPPSPVLDRKAFEDVQEVTQNFEEYIREVKGWSDGKLAHLSAERADHITDVKHSGGHVRTAMSSQAAAPPRDSSIRGIYPRSMGHGADNYGNRTHYAPSPSTPNDRRHNAAPHSLFTPNKSPHLGRADFNDGGAQAPSGGNINLNPETPPRHLGLDRGYGSSPMSDSNFHGSQGPGQAALQANFRQMRVGSPRPQPSGPPQASSEDYRVT